MPATVPPPKPLPVVLLGLKDLVDLLPVAKVTVYRWNSTGASYGGKRDLPEPDLVACGTDLWREERIVAWLKGRGLTPDPEKLAEIRKAQGH